MILQARLYLTYIITYLSLLIQLQKSIIISANKNGSFKSNHKDLSSTLLKIQRMYNKSPHDTKLYDVLDIKPNSTISEITKAYYKKSLLYHPDKKRNNQAIDDDDDDDDDEIENKLEKVRMSYELLKNDITRLAYHTFGFLSENDCNIIIHLLVGSSSSSSPSSSSSNNSVGSKNTYNFTPEQLRLMQLMGFSNTNSNSRKQRVQRVALLIVELIRPLVEDTNTITQADLSYEIAKECNVLKYTPLGAQILRCIGRAYRHSGQHYLRTYNCNNRYDHTTSSSTTNTINIDKTKNTALVVGKMQDKLRSAKYLMTAAYASSKLIFTEQTIKLKLDKYKKKKSKDKNNMKSIGYHYDDDYDFDNDDMFLPSDIENDSDDDNDDAYFTHDTDLSTKENNKEENNAYKAIIQILQIDAIWKISKIELNKIIHEACNDVLYGNYFFFRSSSNRNNRNNKNHYNGWIGSTNTNDNNVIDLHVGRLRAAAALVLIGDIFVRESKSDTSWSS